MRLCGWGRYGSWILLALVGCTPVERAAAPAPEAATSECAALSDRAAVPDRAALSNRAALPVVTTVQTRDHEITVHASNDGLRFTVSLAGGVLLGHQLTEDEFEQSFPGLHQRFSSAFAGDEAWLDASVDARAGTPPGVLHPPGLP